MKALYGLAALASSLAYLAGVWPSPAPSPRGDLYPLPALSSLTTPTPTAPTFSGGEPAFPSPKGRGDGASSPSVNPGTAQPTTSPAIEAIAPLREPTAMVVAASLPSPRELEPDSDLANILLAAGWPRELVEEALAVAYCESRHHFDAVGAGVYMGWLQVGGPGASPDWFAELGVPVSQAFDPLTNARMARTIYSRAGGWGPWPNCQP